MKERVTYLKPKNKQTGDTDALLGSPTPNARREVPNRSSTPTGAAKEPAGNDLCQVSESVILPQGEWVLEEEVSFSPHFSFSQTNNSLTNDFKKVDLQATSLMNFSS